MSSRTRPRMASSCWEGVSPSDEWCWEPARSWRRRPETRTWKNSSRLDAKMARNLTRSRSGLRMSRASWRTRALNSIQDSSRLRIGPFWSRTDRRRLRPATRGPGAGRTVVIDPLCGTPRDRSGPGRTRPHPIPLGPTRIPLRACLRTRDRSRMPGPARACPAPSGASAFRDVPLFAGGGIHPDTQRDAGGRVQEPLLGRPEARRPGGRSRRRPARGRRPSDPRTGTGTACAPGSRPRSAPRPG